MASDEADGRDTVKGNVKYSRRKRLLRMKCSIEISSDAALPVVLCFPFGGADAREGGYVRYHRFPVDHVPRLGLCRFQPQN